MSTQQIPYHALHPFFSLLRTLESMGTSSKPVLVQILWYLDCHSHARGNPGVLLQIMFLPNRKT